MYKILPKLSVIDSNSSMEKLCLSFNSDISFLYDLPFKNNNLGGILLVDDLFVKASA